MHYSFVANPYRFSDSPIIQPLPVQLAAAIFFF